MDIQVYSSNRHFTHKPGTVTNGKVAFERLVRTGFVKVGISNDSPFSYVDPRTKSVTGESWEIAQWVFSQLGIHRLEPVVTEFWSLIPKLLNGSYDIIAAGFYITPIRFRDINFSYPTYQNKEGLVVSRGNPLRIKTLSDVIRHPFAKIAVIFGSATSSHIRLYQLPPSRIIQFADAKDALKGVSDKEADLFITPTIGLQNQVNEYGGGGLEIVPEFQGFIVNGQPVVDFGAFGFRKDDMELRRQFNHHLQPFIGTEAHLNMVAPFGFSRLEMPHPIPSAIATMLS